MSGAAPDDQDKTHEPTPQKLLRARQKGDIARSADLSVAAGYAGLLAAALAVGAGSLTDLGAILAAVLDQADRFDDMMRGGSAGPALRAVLMGAAGAVAPWFAVPAAAVLLSILAQRGFVAAPGKLRPKASRISIPANARNKFGRSGLFEFAKSFAKLVLYSICLGAFLEARLPLLVTAAAGEPQLAVSLLTRLSMEFLFLVLLIAAGIGAVDTLWQHAEHRRKNRMSRKELLDETRDAEGDPHMKQARRQRGQDIALSRMMADLPGADVVIVNPTHYAVALKWSRLPGSAPVCVAKGVDETAATIRRVARESGVPIHHDPPTARALHATVELGQEIAEEHFRAVAAAIRFAERMRARARDAIR
ncbi:MAG: flagellar biosynthesis protein FlhB [Rhodobacteraceae bacterium]|nr:flagellar biosynthesis protein FlhB [Paracoccaceae bacterium]